MTRRMATVCAVSHSGYRLLIQDGSVIFPRLPADGPDPEEPDAVVDTKIRLGRLALTVPLSPSTARRTRWHGRAKRIGMPVAAVLLAVAVTLSVLGQVMSDSGLDGSFFGFLSAVLGWSESLTRPMVHVTRLADGAIVIAGVSGLFASETVALNPAGTVAMSGPWD